MSGRDGEPAVVHDSVAAAGLDAEATLSRKTDVAVAAGNGDFELASELAGVDVVGSGDGGAPPDTLDVGDTGWVGAASVVRVDRWVTLEVDVERSASSDGIALVGTRLDVVGVQEGEAQVVVGVWRGLGVVEDALESDWSWRSLSLRRVVWVCAECGSCVWVGFVADSSWLRVAGRGITLHLLAQNGGSRSSECCGSNEWCV